VSALPTPIIAFPAGVACPLCAGVVEDWHAEWTDPAQGPDFYKGLLPIDCPLCGGWVLYQVVRFAADGYSIKGRRFKPCRLVPIPRRPDGCRSRRQLRSRRGITPQVRLSSLTVRLESLTCGLGSYSRMGA
jgi:hypothetical protein